LLSHVHTRNLLHTQAHSMLSSKNTTPQSPGTIQDVQNRLAQDGGDIINNKLQAKIEHLDQLCMSERYSIGRIKEVRDHTTKAIQNYLDETKRQEKKAEKKAQGGNPLLQLLAGGLSAEQHDEADDIDEADLEDEQAEYAMPKKLLLSRMGLDESNKINLKLSLELETPETKKREAEKKEEDEPETKKAKKSASSTSKKEKEVEKEAEKTEEKNEKEEDKEEDEEDEPPVLHSHPIITAMNTELRGEIDEITEWCATIRAWLQSNISRNKNIGGADLKGDIQMETLAEIMAVEQEFQAHKEQMGAYYVARAGVLEKYTKSPEFEDYRNFIVDEDEKQFVALRSLVSNLRNQTCNLHDVITKDVDQLFNAGSSAKNDAFSGFSMY